MAKTKVSDAELWELYLINKDLRTVAKRVGLSKSAVQKRLIRHAGVDYASKVNGSLLRSIQGNNYGKHQGKIDEWLSEHVVELAEIDSKGNDFYNESFFNNETVSLKKCRQYNEEWGRYNLDYLIEHESEYYHDDAAEIFIDIQDPEEGYINIGDLVEVLKVYFADNLDELLDIHLSRLWLPLYKLIPGNTLLSQLDSADLSRALFMLNNNFYYAICAVHDGLKGEVYDELLSTYVHTNELITIYDYIQKTYNEALMQLSKILFLEIL